MFLMTIKRKLFQNFSEIWLYKYNRNRNILIINKENTINLRGDYIWPITRRNIGIPLHWKINRGEDFKISSTIKSVKKSNRWDRQSNHESAWKQINKTMESRSRSKKRKRKINTMEQRRKERGQGMRGYASGVSSVDDMVHMPVNYPLSLVDETSHPCNVSLDPWGCDSVWSRCDASYARLLC